MSSQSRGKQILASGLYKRLSGLLKFFTASTPKQPTVVDLFCGAGGMSEGFEQAGFKVILGVDNWNIAAKTFKANHPDAEIWIKDALKIDPNEIPKSDVIIGGPPCPDFSTANARKNPERGMINVKWFLDVVEANEPRFWVMENVPPIVPFLPGNIPFIRILNATNYGVPQTRHRCFAGKYPTPIPTHSKFGPMRTLDGRVLEPWVTVRQAIGDLPEPTVLHGKTKSPYLTKREIEMQRKLKSAKTWKSGTKMGAMEFPNNLDEPSRTIIATQRNARETIIIQNPHDKQEFPSPVLSVKRSKAGDDVTGQPYYHINGPAHTIVGNPHRFVEIMGRAEQYLKDHVCRNNINPKTKFKAATKVQFPDKPSHTITGLHRVQFLIDSLHVQPNWKSFTKKYGYSIADSVADSDRPGHTVHTGHGIPEFHPGGLRRLTARECARLQSFPDSFEFFGSLSAKYKQIGNAVPPMLARAIAEAIMGAFAPEVEK